MMMPKGGTVAPRHPPSVAYGDTFPHKGGRFKSRAAPLAAALLAAAIFAAPSAARAWHDTVEGGLQSSGGGVPLDAILPIVAAVIIGGVALAIWGRRTGGKPHRRKRPRR